MDEMASQQLACFDSYAEQRRRRVEEGRARIVEIDSHSTARMHDWIAAHGSNTSFDEYLAEAQASRSRAVAELRSADPIGMGGASFLATELSRQLSGSTYREIQARVEFDSLRVKAQMRVLADFTDRYQNQMAVAAAWASKYGAVAAVTKRLADLPHWPSLANASAMLDSLGVNAAALSTMGRAFEALSARGAMKEASIAALGLGSHGPAILRLPRVSGRDAAEDAGERRSRELRQVVLDVEATPVHDEPSEDALRRRIVISALLEQVRECGNLTPVLALRGKGQLAEGDYWEVFERADAMLQQQAAEMRLRSVQLHPAAEAERAAAWRAAPSGELRSHEAKAGDRAAAARKARKQTKQGYLDRIASDKRKGVSVIARDYASSLADELGLTVGYVRELRAEFLGEDAPE
ncbi:hypothetical protein AB4156_19840 [Cupriavidus sp. 2MCAB6]|uniref:hypothetical protein n=1 Tax=Cupriavidus sp. 2MCAB6 TaxID=3232981 RepID=UPI003F916B8D